MEINKAGGVGGSAPIGDTPSSGGSVTGPQTINMMALLQALTGEMDAASNTLVAAGNLTQNLTKVQASIAKSYQSQIKTMVNKIAGMPTSSNQQQASLQKAETSLGVLQSEQKQAAAAASANTNIETNEAQNATSTVQSANQLYSQVLAPIFNNFSQALSGL